MKPLPMLAGRPKVDLAKVVIDEVTVVGSRCGPFKPVLEALVQTNDRCSLANYRSVSAEEREGSFCRDINHLT